VARVRAIYRERRDVMLKALAEHFPEGCSWTKPLGGLFLWARVPDGLDTEELLALAVEEKVAFVPGHAFYPGGSDGRCCMRLNFSNQPPELIEEGIARLGRAIERLMAAAS
jgi:2-aminoadipate transaminase